jgi:circadian clock protein KaiC
LHELLTHLGQQGAATLLVSVQRGLIGSNMESPVDASYLADAVILLRYFELQGSIRGAISVLKKRSGPHERTLREFSVGAGGVRVGPSLDRFHGVLTGVPRYVGDDLPALG